MLIHSLSNVKIWLLVCALMVLAMIALGGYTRLTDSGLSIVEWKPVTGVIYPFNQSMWEQEFSKYQHSPEYIYKNSSFSLEQFKQIYFVEYSHRLAGRILGIFFTIPFCYFLMTKRLSKKLIRNCIFIFILGAIQGGIGWYMVKSGLLQSPEVSQYRLVLHLLMALLIYGLLVWNFLSLFKFGAIKSYHRYLVGLVLLLFSLVILQIASGGLVAGLNAGLVYNTYPLMDDQFIPKDLLMLNPWYLNLLENITTVQFVHRMLGAIILLCTILFIPIMLIRISDKKLKLAFICALFVVSLQFILGILTLLNAVPIYLGILHQFGAIILFTNLLFVINLLMYQK
ncbi:MAG: COX15/CtaA family protein [Alphaproteobacteria bacterium]|jgi:cytochrome c oxidase assembly protein subunit 15